MSQHLYNKAVAITGEFKVFKSQPKGSWWLVFTKNGKSVMYTSELEAYAAGYSEILDRAFRDTLEIRWQSKRRAALLETFRRMYVNRDGKMDPVSFLNNYKYYENK